MFWATRAISITNQLKLIFFRISVSNSAEITAEWETSLETDVVMAAQKVNGNPVSRQIGWRNEFKEKYSKEILHFKISEMNNINNTTSILIK